MLARAATSRRQERATDGVSLASLLLAEWNHMLRLTRGDAPGAETFKRCGAARAARPVAQRLGRTHGRTTTNWASEPTRLGGTNNRARCARRQRGYSTPPPGALEAIRTFPLAETSAAGRRSCATATPHGPARCSPAAPRRPHNPAAGTAPGPGC